MKINNKYKYLYKFKKPAQKDYLSENDFVFAKNFYETLKNIGGIINIEDVKTDCYFKKIKYRLSRVELKKGAIVYVERWDGNGMPKNAVVTNIEKLKDSAIIKTNVGYFVFSKKNCKDNNIEFNWTCKGVSWEKKNMKWIDGDRYYLNII